MESMDGKGYCSGPPPPQSLGEMVPKQKSQLNSGNYINVVPMPVGVQYHHRRKYTPQMPSDYQ